MSISDAAFNPGDIDAFFRRLNQLVAIYHFDAEVLAQIGVDPILLLTRPYLQGKASVLIAAGFHGDEPAPCWGILQFMEQVTSAILQEVNLSFLPLVNPSGFRKCQRLNASGEDPNRGWWHTASGAPEPARESVILLPHLERLQVVARDACVSLHEDVEFDRFYLYTFEQPGPHALAPVLASVMRQWFEPYPDGPLEGGIAQDGIIYNVHDTSFEDFMFHAGIARTLTTETPGRADIGKRIQTNAALIEAVVEYIATAGR